MRTGLLERLPFLSDMRVQIALWIVVIVSLILLWRAKKPAHS